MMPDDELVDPQDRLVNLIRGDERAAVRLQWARRSGRHDYWIGLDVPEGAIEAVGRDLFDALVGIRNAIASVGWRLAVQGSRRDTYPSGMVRDMIAARRLYVLQTGRHVRKEDLVDIFADADPKSLATPEEQHDNYLAWRASLRPGQSAVPD